MKLNGFFFVMGGLFFSAHSQASTAPIIYNYRIYCITEGKNVYEWNTAAPTTCPNNTAHTINPNSISIVDERAPAVTSIQQETVPTGGWFKTETLIINAATGPGVVTTVTRSWPFNISLLNLYFQTQDANAGDSLIIDWASDQTIGTLTGDVAVGATTANVSASVVQNIAVGFNVSLTDGTNQDDCGRVIAIDSINNIITFETPTVDSFLASSPTYVQVTVTPVDLTFGPALNYNVAQHVIGGSHIPANQVATAYYTNNSAEAKQLYVNLEYFY
jgi:hypothetical protein